MPTHLEQVFKVVSGKPFHFGDITLKTPYRCLAKHRNLSEANENESGGEYQVTRGSCHAPLIEGQHFVRPEKLENADDVRNEILTQTQLELMQ